MSVQDFLGLGSFPQPHRIIPVSASGSLQTALGATPTSRISTGLSQLNEVICREVSEDLLGPDNTQPGGIPRSRITEAFGPPGAGKTSLALSITCNALRQGLKVIWIDTGSPIPKLRLKKMLQKSIETADGSPSTIPEKPITNLIYFRAPSLPHLLALLIHLPKGLPSDDTALLVVDSISSLFPAYFMNPVETKLQLAQAGITDRAHIQWLVSRRWSVMSDLGSQLMKLASAHRLAIFLTNQTHTKMKDQPRATLCPALSGGSWENNIYTRIVLYRDFPSEGADSQTSVKIHIAEVLKRDGKPLILRLRENIIPFTIESDGLYELGLRPLGAKPSSQKPNEAPGAVSQRKRKIDEVADSQDEDESTDEEYDSSTRE